jgi:hypothetical protein
MYFANLARDVDGFMHVTLYVYPPSHGLVVWFGLDKEM